MKTQEQAVYDAVRSLLDLVDELCQGLAHGQTPEKDWAEMVTGVLDEHRVELRDAFGVTA